MSEHCKLCGETASLFDEATILRRHLAKYFRCMTCGFIQTEAPYWLEEAYASPIAKQDTGIMVRNLANRKLTAAVLTLLHPRAKQSLDFGAGHGILLRLMRDRGFNFFWHDPHASNDYGCGFEYNKDQQYDFLTAFEVLEHLVDPIADLTTMINLSHNVFVSTTLLPNPVPRISDWWYYAPDTGQHIAFYTPEALRVLARRFGRHLLSRGSYHLFTTNPKSKALFRLATSRMFSGAVNVVCRRPSLTESDFRRMAR